MGRRWRYLEGRRQAHEHARAQQDARGRILACLPGRFEEGISWGTICGLTGLDADEVDMRLRQLIARGMVVRSEPGTVSNLCTYSLTAHGCAAAELAAGNG